MNSLRVTQNIATADNLTQEFWVWYGLTLLPKVSHKNWRWSDKGVRETVRMYDVVSISDEALAMQVLKLRGARYMDMRSKKKQGISTTNKKGGQSGTADASLKSMTENVACFVEYYNVVKATKDAQKDDSLGWCAYLTVKQVQKCGESSSGKKKKKDTVLNMMDLPVDEVPV